MEEKNIFKKLKEKLKNRPKRQPKEPKPQGKILTFLNDHPLISNIPLALLLDFVIELMCRKSLSDTWSFMVDTPGAYLYNSYIIYVGLTLVLLSSRTTFIRVAVSAVFVALGITNAIILANRVTPFGFTDVSMIGDVLTMNTKYLSTFQVVMVFVGIGVFAIYIWMLHRRGRKHPHKMKLWLRILIMCISFGSVPLVTYGMQQTGILADYFGNLRQGYFDYGYLYGFGTSMFDRGMSRPIGYSDEEVKEILAESDQGETTIDPEDMPNIVVVLCESAFDITDADFIETDQDPLEYYHYLEDNFSSGYLTVPVVGAGTCNSEFEVLTGMSCSFFGPGEYPQKTILKKTDCESIADVLGNLGYGTHVVHNNGGNFYSRANAFSMMGFDTFQSKEMLDITEYTPLGDWPTDDILIQASLDALESTESPDFLYTITVQTHGDYPTYVVEEDPAIKVTCKGKTEEQTNSWSYYINRLNDMDDFMKEYCEALDSTGEPTLVIFFGDHLPTMGLTEDELSTGTLYETKYVTWNNFGMEDLDEDLTTYNLVSEYLDRLGIHGGTMVDYNQYALKKGLKAGTQSYMKDLETLQYDLLYGNRYAYDGEDKYPASDLEMGIADVTIDSIYKFGGEAHIYGDRFTKWSKVYVNGEKVNTTYESGQCLTISASALENGDVVTVCQLGSSNTIFRSSEEFTYTDPTYVEPEEETPEAEDDTAKAEDAAN